MLSVRPSRCRLSRLLRMRDEFYAIRKPTSSRGAHEARLEGRRTQMQPAANLLRSGSDFVLRLGFEVAGVVPLEQLLRRIAGGAVDHAAALHRRARVDLIGPAQHVLVFVRADELGAAI